VTNPDGTPMTVPAALRQTIKQIGQNGGGSYSSSGSAVATTSPSTATHG
jgi:K+-transporting ATPase A subunit